MLNKYVSPVSLLALALIVRSVAFLQVEVIPRDGIYFLQQADHLLQGDWNRALSWYQHPLFAALIACVKSLSGLSLETAGSLVALGAGALAVVPLSLLMTRVFGSKAGVSAGILYAVLPLAVRFSVRPLSEGPFYFFLFLSALAGVETLLRSGRFAPILAGVFGGLAYLVRPEGLAAPLVTLIGVLVFPACRAWKGRISAALLLGLGLAVSAGPYVTFLSHEAGTLKLTAKKDLRVLSGARSDRPLQRLSDEGLSDRGVAASLQLVSHLLESVSYLPVVLALIGGLFPGRKNRSRGEVFLLLLVLLFAAVLFRLAYTYGYLARRHTLTPGLFLLGWSGMGVAWLSTRWNARRRIHACLVLLITAGMLPFAWKNVDRNHLPLKTLGRWIQDHQGKNRRIAPMGYPRIAYYAGADPIDLLSKHQELWSDTPGTEAFEALKKDLIARRIEFIVHAARQPAPLGGWIEAHSALLHRVQDKGKKWWSVRVLSLP